MFSKESIESAVRNREIEKVNLELKSFKKVTPVNQPDGNEKSKEIVADICALANKHGGKILLGISDDGKFEGKFTGDIDDLKGQLFNLCRSRISPIIECQIILIETVDWDVIVIDIPKRKGLPHAIITRENGHEITSRKYYTRTAHGKKFVTDAELEWMFGNTEDPKEIHEFRMGIEFDKKFNIVPLGGYMTRGCYEISHFINHIPRTSLESILENNQFADFCLELTPFLILSTLSRYYKHSWFIKITERFDREASGPMKVPVEVPTTRLNIYDIEFSGYQILNNLPTSYVKTLKDAGHLGGEMCLPIGTSVKIVKDGYQNSIYFANKCFQMELRFGHLSSGSNSHPKNPQRKVIEEISGFGDAYNYLTTNYLHFDCAGYLIGEINFLDISRDDFEKLTNFIETTCKIIDLYWNFNIIVESAPSHEILMTLAKVDELLSIAKTK